MLAHLTERLRGSLGLIHKQDIQQVAQYLGVSSTCNGHPIELGDDCAAIPDGQGYLLIAAEGLWPHLVEAEPWFAGWCAVMVNLSDISAMGGHPLALVDVMWSPAQDLSGQLWQGMQAASQAYQVPIVGGHTNTRSPYSALAVTVVGRAQHLITSFSASPGDDLVMVIDPAGQRFGHYPFWNAATQADPAQLREKLDLLPQLAAEGLCRTGKDISMGGVIGTTLMLLEASGVGGILKVDHIPHPPEFSLEEWLCCFPSYGFLLSVDPSSTETIRKRFQAQALDCWIIGQITNSRQLWLQSCQEKVLFWDLRQQGVTGFSSPRV